jgi:hypothetical protein
MITITTPHANVMTGGPLKEKADDARALFGTGFRTPTHVGYYVEDSFLSVVEAVSMLAIPKTELSGMNLFIEVDSPDDKVPSELFGYSEGLTWAEWCKDNKPPVEREGRFFIRTSSNTNNFPDLSELKPVHDKLATLAYLQSLDTGEVN